MKTFLFQLKTAQIDCSGSISSETIEEAIQGLAGKDIVRINPIQTIHRRGRTTITQAQVKDEHGGVLDIIEFTLGDNHKPLDF